MATRGCKHYYNYKCQEYNAAITQLRRRFTKSTSKTVAQLNADVCRLSECTALLGQSANGRQVRVGDKQIISIRKQDGVIA